jgi:hypothetical protein
MEEGVGGGIDLAASCKWCKHSYSWLGHVEHREPLSTGELQTYPARSPSFVKVLVDSNLAAMATCWMVSNTPGTALSCPWIWHNVNELQSFVGLSMLQEACKKIELEIIPKELLDIPIFRSLFLIVYKKAMLGATGCISHSCIQLDFWIIKLSASLCLLKVHWARRQ